MARPRTAGHLSSALALAACLCAQLGGALHSAMVQHVACAEHGGVVEVRAESSRAVVQPGHATLRAAASEAHHTHCDLCATFSAVRGANPPASHADAFVVAPLVRAHAAPLVVRALFRLAPKGSPPRSVTA